MTVEEWAIKCLEPMHLESGYDMGYEKSWYCPKEHLNYRVRLVRHDNGFWLVMGVAGGRYDAQEEHWSMANYDTVASVECLDLIFTGVAGITGK